MRGGLYAERVKAYTDNFERVLILLFEEDIVTGQWEEKVLDFLNLDPLPEGLGNLHKNKSKRIYRKILEANLKKEAMAPETRQMLKEKFRGDVALLAEYTGLPVYKFWTDFQDASYLEVAT